MSISKGKLLRIFGSVVLIALVFQTVEIEQITKIIKQINFWLYALTFAVFLTNKLLATYRWKLLLQVQGIQNGLLALYKVNLFGQIFNIILPSTLGGDSVRVYWLIKQHPKKRGASIIATATDRFLGLIAMIFLALISLPFNTLFEPQYQRIGMAILGLTLAILAILVWSPGNWATTFVRKFMFTQWLKERYDETLDILKMYKNSKGAILTTFLLALLFQIIAVANAYFRFRTIGVDVPIQYLFLAIPITTLIVTIPISIGGFGLREISLIGLLGGIGLQNYEVVSYTLISYSFVLILAVVMAILNIADEPLRQTWSDSSSDSNSSDTDRI